jgi:endonuclease YncB( thermonuclease family)
MQIDLSTHPFNFPAKKQRTIDGDTLVVDIDMGFGTFAKNRSVRILGLDTPETRTKDDLEKEAGIRVKNWVDAVTPNDLTVLSIELDKYGRILGDVIWPVTTYSVDPLSWMGRSHIIKEAAVNRPYLSIQRLLIENGLARLYDGGKRKKWTKTKLREIIRIVKADFDSLK